MVDSAQVLNFHARLGMRDNRKMSVTCRPNGRVERSSAVFSEGALSVDPAVSARIASLHYVSDDKPGIKRIRNGRGFVYVDVGGKVIREPVERRRIKSLAIPPAWTDVWICPRSDGHLQATGRDAKGRKQHLYHQRWREVRDENKFERVVAFAQTLPLIRKKVAEDLRLKGIVREKILAAVVRLLETTFIRIGNEEYARNNNSFGLATMRNRHVRVSGSQIVFKFRGKSGIEHAIDLQDRQLAKIIKQCQDLPGYDLFQYLNGDGELCSVGAEDVNAYLRQIAGADFSTKDFRTWAGTVLAAHILGGFEPFESQSEANRNIGQAIAFVAKRLGNTKAVCRKSYIHPGVIDAYRDGRLVRKFSNGRPQNSTRSRYDLLPRESSVVTILQQQLKNNGTKVPKYKWQAKERNR
jgi:DNA topoisomerase-1